MNTVCASEMLAIFLNNKNWFCSKYSRIISIGFLSILKILIYINITSISGDITKNVESYFFTAAILFYCMTIRHSQSRLF